MPHLSSSKAKKILKDKSVRGKKLTAKQRGFFGAIASGKIDEKARKRRLMQLRGK